MRRPKRMAECHPDRPHRAKGLCDACYALKRYYKKIEANPQQLVKNRERLRAWRKANPERLKNIERRAKRLMRYGLTERDFTALRQIQNGQCAISGRPLHEGRRGNTFAIDHNHKTGAVRGLILSKLNRALGAFEDSPQMLRQAADYLENPPFSRLSLPQPQQENAPTVKTARKEIRQNHETTEKTVIE